MRARPLQGIAALVLFVPSMTTAQNANVRTSLGNAASVAPGGTLDVPIVLDVSGAAGLSVASLTVKVAWDPARLTLGSTAPGTFGSLTNTTGPGQATLTASSAAAASGIVTVATLRFQASAAGGASPVSLGVQAAGDTQGQSVRARVGAQSLAVCVGSGGGLWGDVNGDAQVDILDAQQIARYVVGLPVADHARVTANGDVNGDAQVDILDAQQIARYVVGLSASARIAQQAPGGCGALGAVAAVRVTPSAPALTPGQSTALAAAVVDAAGATLVGHAVTWSSASPAIATVDAAGMVSAVAPGTAAITATSEGVSGTVQVTVTSQPAFYTLTVLGAGPNGGGVVSSPPTFNCAIADGKTQGGACALVVPRGGTVALQGAADVSSLFVGFGGDCAGTGTCQLLMDRDRVVTARFASRVQSLDVGLIGTGYGTASIQLFDGGSLIENQICDIGMAVGPSRGGCFFGEYPYGSTVKLTAEPGYSFNSANNFIWYAGLAFGGWSNAACTDSAYACTFALTGPSVVTVRFDSLAYAEFYVNRTGTGGGSVTGQWALTRAPVASESHTCVDKPGSISPPDCSWRVNLGTVLKLQAAPDTVSRFIQWEGDTSLCGTNPTCSVTVKPGLNISVRFDSP